MNIASSIDNMAFVIFIGLGNACAILVGNRIGAGEEKQAFRYAGRSLGLSIVGGLLVGGLILAISPLILDIYKVSPLVIDYTRKILLIISAFLWLRASNLILFIGVFRSGGDTRFGFFLDAGTIWAVGVPLAVLGAFVFHLPVYLVYLLVMMDELTKFVVGSGATSPVAGSTTWRAIDRGGSEGKHLRNRWLMEQDYPCLTRSVAPPMPGMGQRQPVHPVALIQPGAHAVRQGGRIGIIRRGQRQIEPLVAFGGGTRLPFRRTAGSPHRCPNIRAAPARF